MLLVHSKVKTYRSVRSDTSIIDTPVYGDTAIRGNTAPNEMETYRTMNLNTELAVGFDTANRGNTALTDVETYQIMDLEYEKPRHNCYASDY